MDWGAALQRHRADGARAVDAWRARRLVAYDVAARTAVGDCAWGLAPPRPWTALDEHEQYGHMILQRRDTDRTAAGMNLSSR